MIPAVIMTCPALNRDVAPILAKVPDAIIWNTEHLPEQHEGLRRGLARVAEMARRLGWPAAWILEDDCQFTEHFDRARFESDAAWAFLHGYTLLNGGVFSAANPRPVREGLVAVDRFKSSHCIVVHHSAYDVLERLGYPADVTMGTLGAKSVVTVPFVAVQGAVHSGHLDRQTDFRARYAQTEASLRQIARAA
ncbi:MAG TPA: hypothetical protein VF422_09960 [Dokdonella sp.]